MKETVASLVIGTNCSSTFSPFLRSSHWYWGLEKGGTVDVLVNGCDCPICGSGAV